MYEFLRRMSRIHSIGVGYIIDHLWVKTRVVFVATAVMVPPTVTRATIATEVIETTLTTVYDTLLVQLLPI